MDQIIDHTAPKIHLALGLKEAHEEKVREILHDHFIEHTPEGDKRGHEKTSISLCNLIAYAKKIVFNDEGPVQEYEATVAYLGYLLGAEIASHRMHMEMKRDQLAQMLFGAEMHLPGMPHQKKEAIIMEVNSEEEAILQQSVIKNMAKGNFSQAMANMVRLKDIKAAGKKPKKKQPAKKGKGSKKQPKNKPQSKR